MNIIERHKPCPACSSSDAYCLYEDGHGYCFSCRKYFPKDGGSIDFVNDQFSFEYLPWRNVTKETMAFYDVLTKIAPDGKPISLGYRYPDGSYKIRHRDAKDFFWNNKAGSGLFGRDKFPSGSHKFVTITEGELDALSLYQVVKSPVVSVSSAGAALRDISSDYDYLAGFDTIVLAFDNDAAGREAVHRCAKLFEYSKLRILKYDTRKDANDFLGAGEIDELRNIWWNSKPYMPEHIVSSFADFKKILEATPQEGVPYPFQKLTEMTYGIRKGESVLITAQEGVGKTELMHAIEHQILKRTQDNVGAIYLEEPEGRHLQALAGLELGKPVHLPDSGVSVVEVADAVQKLVQKDERLHVYSNFGSVDPDILLSTIRFLVCARSCSYILLDHITMVVSGLTGDGERRVLDQFATKLETLVKELNFSLIIVSHVNDEGQTRGSRYISKVADIRVDLQRDLLSGDAVTRGTTYIVVSKNRFSGKTGPAGSFQFDPLRYKFLDHSALGGVDVAQVANDNGRASQLVA